MSFVSDKFNESFNLEEAVNNKTLKQVLLSVFRELGKELISDNDQDYCIHHLNHEQDDNNLYNICIVNRKQHQSYHNKVRSKDFINSNKTKQQLFNEICTDRIDLYDLLSPLLRLRDEEK